MNIPRLPAAWLLVPLALFIPNICLGQEVPQLTAGRLSGDARPQIDGRVDDEPWSTASPYSSFTQQEPDDGEPATERTEIRFLIDRQNLYIGVVSFDSEPEKIIVSQSRRDADLGDTDSIQILLDTFNDGQNAFVFGTNPFGIEYDGQVMGEGQSGRFNTNWDADWTVRAQMTERGWEAETSSSAVKKRVWNLRRSG